MREIEKWQGDVLSADVKTDLQFAQRAQGYVDVFKRCLGGGTVVFAVC